MHIKKLQYQETLAIRQEVLWPNKPIEFCIVENDETAWHYGVFFDKKLVCVASVYPIVSTENKKQARLRKFATLKTHQNQGIGSFILKHIIDSLNAEGIEYFWCDARESALEFYQRFGLQTEGERFYKGNIPYVKMQMTLGKI